MTESVSVAGVFRDVTGKPFNSDRDAIRQLNRMTDHDDYLLVSLPIAHLNATQPTVHDDFRAAARRRYGDGYDLPAVVKYRGLYYITDGHHRLMGAAADGFSSASVRLYDLDGDTMLDFPLLDRMGHAIDIPSNSDGHSRTQLPETSAQTEAAEKADAISLPS